LWTVRGATELCQFIIPTFSTMDSMRNLRTVLPSTTPRRQASYPPEQLLAAFREAALSVTTLYKAAASEQEQAYKEGYQDALEELLKFLDNENLGLQDGEGWRVRQWATERFQGAEAPTNSGSDDEEEAEEEKRARSSSPTVQQRKQSEDLVHPEPRRGKLVEVAARPESAPPSSSPVVEPELRPLPTTWTVPTADFSFRSSHQMPPNHDVEMDSSESQRGPTAGQPSNALFQVNLIPRASRSTSRRGNATPRSGNRSRNALGGGAGNKRSAIEMFSDISGFNVKDAPGGGGKRGRFA
jgi:hypothetical protein